MKHAQHDHGHRGNDHAGAVTAKDPVCGMTVNPASASHFYDYKGTRYYFCCDGCRSMFAADPAKYLAKTAPAPPAHSNTKKSSA